MNLKNAQILKWRSLCEIDAGICDGMTYEEIAIKMPSEWKERKQDKLTYRYPQGESYKDVIHRLEPVIFELERSTKPVLIISHRAVLRCLYAYFMDKPLKEIPYLPINLHTVYKLTPKDYGTEVDKFTFGLVASKPIGKLIEQEELQQEIYEQEVNKQMKSSHSLLQPKKNLL